MPPAFYKITDDKSGVAAKQLANSALFRASDTKANDEHGKSFFILIVKMLSQHLQASVHTIKCLFLR